jgi:hypothetical protein
VAGAELNYCLRRLESSQQDGDVLARALAIYHADTPHMEATATNDFLYWIDRYNDKFEDKLFMFALQVNGAVVGFAECVYFTDQNFVVIDYMTVDDRHKTVAVFLQFYELIREFFREKAIFYDLVVAEILLDNEQKYTESSDFWRAVMAFERFRVVEADFFQPQLGRTKYETALPARLLISLDDASSFDRQTYMMIVETIILRHYVRWYEPFFNKAELTAYREKAEATVESIRASVGARPQLQLSEMSPVVLPSGSVQARYRSSAKFIAYESISYVILLAMLVTLRVGFSVGALEIMILAIGALFLRMALLSVFVPEAREVVANSLSALSLFLGKKQPVARDSAQRSSKT